MADDERRAEIEAMTDAISYALRPRVAGVPVFDPVRALMAAEAARDALDRVRDARGDGERRTEIEAARELLRAWDARELSHPEHPATHWQWADWMNEAADRLRAILDRVRDARGDEEAVRCPQCGRTRDDIREGQGCGDYERCPGTLARSPQGEDHETSDAVRGDLHGTPVEWPERQPTDPDRGQLRDAATPASGRGRQSADARGDGESIDPMMLSSEEHEAFNRGYAQGLRAARSRDARGNDEEGACVMADDERRVEAPEEVMRRFLDCAAGGDSPQALAPIATRLMAEALDRVRDAQGDDEKTPDDPVTP